MAVGDFYELKLSGNTNGVTVLNIFHFEMTAGSGGGSLQLGNAFLLNTVDNIGSVCSSDTTFTDLEVRNLNNGTDFSVEAFSFSGVRGSNSATTFLAWSYTYNPSNINFRAGGKRFGSIAALDLVDNSPSATILSNLNGLAVALGGALSGGGNTYRPRIKRKTPLSAPATYTYVNVDSVVFHRLSTQGTRKPWIGV